MCRPQRPTGGPPGTNCPLSDIGPTYEFQSAMWTGEFDFASNGIPAYELLTRRHSSGMGKRYSLNVSEHEGKTLYRYMDKCYVEKFFQQGALQLGSFLHFAELEDESRRDDSEGFKEILVQGKVGGVFREYRSGLTSLVLCTSMDGNKWASKWGDAAIQINDPTRFGIAVTDAIKECIEGAEGPCIYAEGSRIGLKIRAALHASQMNRWPPKQDLLPSSMECFVKEARFQADQEYRFAWRLRDEPAATLEINCSGAVRFCEPRYCR
jgi:hypothetical protein